MGQKKSIFSYEEMEDYLDLTYLSRKDIRKCWDKFFQLNPDILKEDKNAQLPMKDLLKYPELQVNPFADRICLIFSSTNDGFCSFEDFLNMLSVFSRNSPLTLKAEYAFRIFDFDNDDLIGPEDMTEIVLRLVGARRTLKKAQIYKFVECILSEADLDDDGQLNYNEFRQILSKSMDFDESFQMRV